MVELLSGNVVACVGNGRITKDDYEKVLIPSIEQALSRNAKIRCYYELGRDYSGDTDAAWEDFKIGVEHLTRWSASRLSPTLIGCALPPMLSVF
jgi:hypothetical protein